MSCTTQGHCCSQDGTCGSGPRYCKAGHAEFNADATVTCDTYVPQRKRAACEIAASRTDAVLPPRCGPSRNAMCPWRRGQDLCCVADTDGNQGDGVCLECASLSPEERGRMLVWSQDGAKKTGGWY